MPVEKFDSVILSVICHPPPTKNALVNYNGLQVSYSLSGLVRGINMVERLFYIVTPEPIQTLANVNCLILGKNDLPDSVYTHTKVSL